MQKQFQSPVGCVVDIATPSKGKLRALGFLWLLIALLPIVVINYVIIQLFTSANPLVTGLMELPIRLLRLLLTNKQHEAAQKQGIKLGIQEMTT